MFIWLNENNSGGLNMPTDKGGRLIVCHAGLKDRTKTLVCKRVVAKLVFRSNTGNTTDYHNQMNGEVFKE
jgi:hypothetical protein